MRIISSFQNLESTCQALGTFASARSQEKPDKDIILTVRKINGHKKLETIRLSKMTLCERLIRWFGFGGSTLKSVASFLECHEPYIPKSFSQLKNRKILSFYYTEDVVNKLENLEKKQWKELKKQKVQGCEIFKACLSHHNSQHSKKIYILLQEEEKVDLRGAWSISGGGVSHSSPNPMGIFQDGDEKLLRERYRPPIIDKNEFSYRNPFFRSKQNSSPTVLGFCYEYGLGTKRDLKKAFQNYHEAAEQNEYSACYNLARLYLKKKGFAHEVIDSLKKAEEILLKKICDAQKAIEDLRQTPDHVWMRELFKDLPEREETKEEYDRRMNRVKELEQRNGCFIKKWNKDLKRVYRVFIEAYNQAGSPGLKAKYEQKLNQMT